MNVPSSKGSARPGPYAHLIDESRTIGTAPLIIHQMTLPQGHYIEPPTDYLSLTVVLKAQGTAVRDFGAGRVRHHYRRGDIDLISPGAAVEIDSDGPQTLITLEMASQTMRDAVIDYIPDFDGDFGRLHAAPFQETLIEKTCMRLWEESTKTAGQATLFAEGAVMTLVAELTRISDLKMPLKSEANGGLGQRDLARVIEYCEAHLDTNMSIAVLAALIDMPMARFTRAFKAATGQSPHRFVVERRIARAKDLLAQKDVSLAEVAYASGFASQSHMTDVFRNRVGIAPGRFRKDATK